MIELNSFTYAVMAVAVIAWAVWQIVDDCKNGDY